MDDADAYRTTVKETETRPLAQSIKRGVLNTCPACGSSRLFKSYLKPVDSCAACGAEMFHHRSDDLPPYIVIVILGHVVLTLYLLTDSLLPASLWLQLAIWMPLTLILAFAIIQPVKGGVIGLQWALRLHGFGGSDTNDPPAEV